MSLQKTLQFCFQYPRNKRYPLYFRFNTTKLNFEIIECSVSLECKEGWYGENCRHQCVEHCRYNSTCNHVTGQCEKVCTAGWTGFLCDIGVFL